MQSAQVNECRLHAEVISTMVLEIVSSAWKGLKGRTKERLSKPTKTAEYRGLPPSPIQGLDDPLTAQHAVAATASSAFFTKLHPELRRQILENAFGYRTVHIQSQRPLTVWRGRRGRRDKAPERLGCVCRRLVESSYENPGTDHCLHGQWPSETERTWIGVLGWLGSCRQAYVEGIEVLYATNTFHIRAESWTAWPDAYIPPARLDVVTSLDWVLSHSFLPTSGYWAADTDVMLSALGRMLRGILETMPGLRRLYVGFTAGVILGVSTPPPSDPRERWHFYVDRVLPVVDRVVRDFARQGGFLSGRLKDFEVALPTSGFAAQWYKGLEAGERFQNPSSGPGPGRDRMMKRAQWEYHARDRIWRTVSPVKGNGGGEGEGKGKEEEEEVASADIGYWLGETEMDMPYGWLVNIPRYWEKENPRQFLEYTAPCFGTG